MYSKRIRIIRALCFVPLIMLIILFGGISSAPQSVVADALVRQIPDEWQLVEDLDPDFAVAWMDLVYDAVRAESVNPPASARVYAYAGVTLYEALFPGMPFNRSYVNQLNWLNDLPYPDESVNYDWIVVTSVAMQTVLDGLFRGSDQDTLDSFIQLRDEQIEARTEIVDDSDVIENSLLYGEELGKAMIGWAEDDGYLETRALNPDYEMPTGEPFMWALTSPNTRPVEPYWTQVRPFALSFADECASPMNYEFSIEEDSTFYQQAFEVYEIGNNLTQQQRDDVEWWIDTPGITGAPAGHWIKIGTQMVSHLDLDLVRTAEMYSLLGIGVADAFISCWSQKYQANLLRPVTYIQTYISRRWNPIVETPPFPEYPSGHSVVSGAAADVLTNLFGQVAFTDTANVDRGLAPHSFTSFEQAAREAANSRIYGGIHFRAAVENGVRQGQCVTARIFDNIVLNPIRQGE